MLKQIPSRVPGGETVTFRQTANSMVPLIHNRDEVVVSPVDPAQVEVGDIVLNKVAGNVYVHLIRHRHFDRPSRASGRKGKSPTAEYRDSRSSPSRRTGIFSVGSGHPPIWRKPFVGCVGSVLLA